MPGAWPCKVLRKTGPAHQQSFASSTQSGRISDMNVQATENASLEAPRARISATRRRVVFQFISIGHWSRRGPIHHVNDGNLIRRKQFNTCQPSHNCHPISRPKSSPTARKRAKQTLHVNKVLCPQKHLVALPGPQQSGKTTLARQLVAADSLNDFDLEDPASLARLSEPDTALHPLKGLMVIDEIQRCPYLFPLLRVLADRKPLPARYRLITYAARDYRASHVCSAPLSPKSTDVTKPRC